jgi:predicted TIM-barrel fold metal-dependent hydrolase
MPGAALLDPVRKSAPLLANKDWTNKDHVEEAPMSRLAGKFFSRCGCCEPIPSLAAPSLDRRRFVAGGATALGLGLGGASALAPGALAQAKPQRIDVHHHIIPPIQAEALKANLGTNPVKWSVQASLEDMDKGGVATSITSIQNPGVWFGKVDDPSRKLARECNEYAARLEKDHPGKFRTFAVIPLPDTEGSLREIEYALDTLKAEGIALWTVYSGKYLGDPAFVPVFEELNRRKAVVYTHPTVPDCCAALVKGVPVSSLEYNHDTTRTIASLVFGEGKTALRFPDIKFIWSHSGGTLPYLTSRFELLAKSRPNDFPDGAVSVFKRFYYEVAQGNTPGMLSALFHMVPVSQVMFGSDYPYRDAKEAVDGLANYKLSAADLRAIEYENALKMFPRLKSA